MQYKSHITKNANVRVKVRLMRRLFRVPLVIAGLAVAFSVFILGYFFGQRFRQESFYITLEKTAPRHEEDEYEPALTAEKLNINTAGAEQLCELKGIGPVIAERIIEYREENGGFNYTFELLNVTGIGKAVYEEIKEKITVD